jgi:hypothetical protein
MLLKACAKRAPLGVLALVIAAGTSWAILPLLLTVWLLTAAYEAALSWRKVEHLGDQIVMLAAAEQVRGLIERPTPVTLQPHERVLAFAQRGRYVGVAKVANAEHAEAGTYQSSLAGLSAITYADRMEAVLHLRGRLGLRRPDQVRETGELIHAVAVWLLRLLLATIARTPDLMLAAVALVLALVDQRRDRVTGVHGSVAVANTPVGYQARHTGEQPIVAAEPKPDRAPTPQMPPDGPNRGKGARLGLAPDWRERSGELPYVRFFGRPDQMVERETAGMS